MFSWILLIILLALCVVVGAWLSGRILAKTPTGDSAFPPADESRDVVAHNRSAVARSDFDAVRFDVVSHGYRQDQVDDLLAALKAELSAPHVQES